MGIYNQLMDQLDDHGLLFNVAEEGVLTASGQVIPNKKALINQSTGQVMSVVSEGYRTVTNEEIFSSFCRSVEQSGIDGTDSTINVRRTPTGSRAIVDFNFLNHQIDINGDKTALQICALNSFDGSTRYTTKAGGLRIRCLNGQILGNIVGAYSSTHSRGLDVQAGADQVIKMIQEFQGAKEYWQALMLKPVSLGQAHEVIREFLNLSRSEKWRDNSRFQKVCEIHNAYLSTMGHTGWALYNTLTDYVTHKQSRNEKTAFSSQITMRNQLEKVMTSREELLA